jgi:hypothetical protein
MASTGACSRQLLVAGLRQPSPEQLDRQRGFEWHRYDGGPFRIRTEVGARNIDRLPAITDSLVAALQQVRTTLSLAPDTLPIHVYIVESTDRMHDLLGHRVSGRAFHCTRVLGLVAAGNWAPTAAHELTHVALGRQWGGRYERWISEGTATWVGNPFHGRDLHRVTRERLVEAGRLLPLRNLAREFGRHPDEVTYLQAASIARFLRERFGPDALRAVWRDGLDAIPSATGLSVAEFERAWRDVVDAARPP